MQPTVVCGCGVPMLFITGRGNLRRTTVVGISSEIGQTDVPQYVTSGRWGEARNM